MRPTLPLVLGLLCLSGAARADSPVQSGIDEPVAYRLAFTNIAGCPGESGLRAQVMAWVGYDPFVPGAAELVKVSMAKKGDTYTATFSVVYADGKESRNVNRSDTDCAALFRTMGIRIGLSIVPSASPLPEAQPAPPAPPPEPAPAPPPEPGPAPIAVEPPKPAEPPPVELPARARLVPRVGFGAEATFGAAWGAVFGVTFEGGVQRQEWRWGGWSLMAKFHWAPQQPAFGPPSEDPTIDVSTSLMAGTLTGCVHRAWPVSLAGCILAELGEVQQSAGTPMRPNLHQTALFGGGGMGARIEFRLPTPFYFQIETNVLGVAKLAGSTNQLTYVFGRSFEGAVGRLGAGLGASF